MTMMSRRGFWTLEGGHQQHHPYHRSMKRRHNNARRARRNVGLCVAPPRDDGILTNSSTEEDATTTTTTTIPPTPTTTSEEGKAKTKPPHFDGRNFRKKRDEVDEYKLVTREEKESLREKVVNHLWLAPLTKGGNLPFRRLCATFQAKVLVSEMSYARFLNRGSPVEKTHLRRHEIGGDFRRADCDEPNRRRRSIGEDGVRV